jgi:hypothetical protein
LNHQLLFRCFGIETRQPLESRSSILPEQVNLSPLLQNLGLSLNQELLPLCKVRSPLLESLLSLDQTILRGVNLDTPVFQSGVLAITISLRNGPGFLLRSSKESLRLEPSSGHDFLCTRFGIATNPPMIRTSSEKSGYGAYQYRHHADNQGP